MLSDEEREKLGGPDGPWINDDWDGLLDMIDTLLAAREREAARRAWDEGWNAGNADGGDNYGWGADTPTPNPYAADDGGSND